MAYCTQTDVERYLQPIPGSDVDGAIQAATDKIDLATGDIFEPRSKTIYTETNRNNTAELPYTTQSITQVTWLPQETVLGPEAYELENFEDTKHPRIRLFATTPFNLLTAGQEPYTIVRLPKARLKVEGVFGYTAIPFQIKEATALLAAYYLFLSGFGDLKDRATEIIGRDAEVSSITVEGYSVQYREAKSTLRETTGIVNLDRFIEPYARHKRMQVG